MVGCSHHGVDDVAPNAAGAASMPNKDTKNNFFMFFLLSLILSNFYIVRKQLISRYSHSYVVVFNFLPVGHVHDDVPHVPPVALHASSGVKYTHRIVPAFHFFCFVSDVPSAFVISYVPYVHSDVVSLHVPPVFVQPSLGDATVPSSGDAQYPHFVLALVSI